MEKPHDRIQNISSAGVVELMESAVMHLEQSSYDLSPDGIRLDKVKKGIGQYCAIMQQLQKTDVSADRDFQKQFNGFYRIRQRPAAFYNCYYAYLEQHKQDTQLNFRQVLEYLYEKTGAIHASFGSKLLATVRPEMPVWDKYVLKNLGLKPPYSYAKNRLEKVCALYDSICAWYQTQEARDRIQLFDSLFPGIDISEVKKIDLLLWQTR